MTEPEAPTTLTLTYQDYAQRGLVPPMPASGLSDFQMFAVIEGARQREAALAAPQVQQPLGPTEHDFEALARRVLAGKRGDVQAAADWLVMWRREQPYSAETPVIDLGFRIVLVEYLGRMAAKTKNKR